MWKLTDSFIISMILLITVPLILSLSRSLKNSRDLNKSLLSENYEVVKENTELKSKHIVIMRRIHDIKEKFENYGKAIERQIRKTGGK